ncbi:MAG: hypothetical protein JW784_03920, partial [Candidatus Cloacimonetes bacterium]|nr:hypothetical protein [Candidatus Cloacimonadota bacterium]
MKQIYVIIILIFIITLLWPEEQVILPFSSSTVKSNQNLVQGLYSVDPADSTSCPSSNKVWFWYDRKKIYFLWEMADQEGFSPGRFTPEDKWPDADYIRIQLITDVKSYHSYSFYAFPLGNRYDGIRRPDHSFDKNWDSSYQYQANLSPKSWSVLMEIPFKDLRFLGTAPYSWKLILSRYIKAADRTYSSPFVITRMGQDYFRRAATIVLDQEISRSLNLFFRPYLIFNYDLEADKQEFDVDNLGIDISANPGYSTRIKASINPDFSDVPLDDELDIYNSRYAPVLEENRYFFIEDLNVFGIDNNIFYSRHINQPQYALKFTSNSHHFSFGFLSTRDRSSNFSHDDLYNIISFKPSSQKSSLQITLLNRMNIDLKKYHNEVLHLAPQIEIGRYTYLWSEFNLSYKDLDSQQTTGYYGKIGLSKYLKDFYFTLSAQQMSRDYAMDMGRIYEDDFYGWNISV